MVKDGFTLLQEVDYLFNYVIHVEKVFSRKQSTLKSERERNDRILKYFNKMSECYDSKDEDEIRRIKNAKLVKRLTSPSKIMGLSKSEVRSVLDVFNCLANDYRGHITDILKNNTLKTILHNWDQLLNQGPITYEKVLTCQKAIDHFGESSVSELIAWRFPDEFPIMNSCSKNGLRFFGVKI